MGLRSCALLASVLLAAAAGVRMPEMAHSHVPAVANRSRASAGAEEPFTPAKCLWQLASSGFSLTDFDRYGEWFDDESEMTLAETGTYKGVDAIREYVEYTSDVSPYRARVRTFQQKPDVKSVDPSTGECVVNVFVAAAAQFAFSTKKTSKTYSATVLVQLTFKPRFDGIRISKANVYYHPKFFEMYGDTVFDNDPSMLVRSIVYICGKLKDSCPDTWAANKYITPTDCVKDYDKLPTLTYANGGPRFDGNSLSCKMMHAAFAFKNPHHCAHVSVVPMADPDGKIKCQTSSSVVASDLFDPEDLADLDSFTAQKGIPPEGYYLCDCSKEGGWNFQLPWRVQRCLLCAF